MPDVIGWGREMEINVHTDLDDFVLWLCSMLLAHGPCRLEKRGLRFDLKFDDGTSRSVTIVKSSLRYKVERLDALAAVLENE